MEFIVGACMPMWFKVGVLHRFTYGQIHILYQLKFLKHQSSEVVNIVMPTVRHSAWHAFSKSIIQTMLCIENVEERIDGIS